jgi:hypothetical protein
VNRHDTQEKGTHLATCTVSASPAVALRAGRAFFFRKWRTKFGLITLGAIVIDIAVLISVLIWIGPDNMLVGMLATILMLMAVFQGASFFIIPRTLARVAGRTPQITSEIEVTEDGLTVRSGKNTNFLPWKVFSSVWIYDDFVVLPIGKFALNRFLWVPTAGMTADVRAAFKAARDRLTTRSHHADAGAQQY